MVATQQILFKIGTEKYGFDVSCINGIEVVGEITSVQNVGENILGIVKVRDEIYPVYSLRAKLGMEDRKETSNRVILTRCDGAEVAYKVDEIQEIVEFEEGNLHELPSFLKNGPLSYVKTIASQGEKLIMLLDENRILSSDEKNTLLHNKK